MHLLSSIGMLVLWSAFLLILSPQYALSTRCGVNQTTRAAPTGDPICCFNITCKQGSNQRPEPCQFQGGTDKCVDCPVDTCNAARVNSLNLSYFSDLCVRVYSVCDTSFLGGTLIYRNKTTCEVKCKCDRLRGFYKFDPDTMDCLKSGTFCLNISEWLNDQGECEACQAGFVQDETYGDCVKRPYRTILSTITTERNKIRPKITTEENKFWPTATTEGSNIWTRSTTERINVTGISEEHRGSGDSVKEVVIPVAIVSVFAVFAIIVGVVVAGRLVYRRVRRMTQASEQYPLPDHQTDHDDPQSSDQIEMEIQTQLDTNDVNGAAGNEYVQVPIQASRKTESENMPNGTHDQAQNARGSRVLHNGYIRIPSNDPHPTESANAPNATYEPTQNGRVSRVLDNPQNVSYASTNGQLVSNPEPDADADPEHDENEHQSNDRKS